MLPKLSRMSIAKTSLWRLLSCKLMASNFKARYILLLMKVQTTTVSRKRLQERIQCSARTVAVQCKDGCRAVQGRMQCAASKLGLNWRRNRRYYSDKRKGMKDSPYGALELPKIFLLNQNFYRTAICLSPLVFYWRKSRRASCQRLNVSPLGERLTIQRKALMISRFCVASLNSRSPWPKLT